MRTPSLRRTTAADPSAAIQRLPRCAEMLWSARCVSSSLNQDDERLHFALLLSRPRPFSTGNYAPRPPRPQARRASPNARRRAACTVGRVSDSERKRPTAASVDTELEFSYLAHRRQPGMYVPPTEAALGYSVHRRPPSAPHPKRAKNQPHASQLTWSGRSPTASPCPTSCCSRATGTTTTGGTSSTPPRLHATPARSGTNDWRRCPAQPLRCALRSWPACP